jgi:hypothetical protein
MTLSNDGDVTDNHGKEDCWVVKLSSFGELEWQKAIGGSNVDEAYSIAQTVDGGYILGAYSDSNNGDVSGNHGSFDCWVVKLNAIGEISWQKSFGGSELDEIHSIKLTADGGYIMAGETKSNDGDITENHGNVDYWVVKMTALGEIEWQKTLGGSALDVAEDILQTEDDNYIIAGYSSSSNTGDITGHHGGFDFWIVKLNGSGAILWQKTLGGSINDWGRAIDTTSDGSYIITGTTTSSNGDVIGNDGGADIWVVKLSSSGTLIWQKTYGGSQAEEGYAIQQTSDDGFILAGYAWSNDGDVSGVHGYNDFWLVKLSPESVGTAEVPLSIETGLEIYPNPTQQSVSLKIAADETSLNITISDLLGRTVRRTDINNGGELDLSTLAKGLYLVVARAGSGNAFSGKLVKE